VPAPLSARVIDLARNRTVVFRAGAQTVPITSQTLALARLTSEGSPAWKSENATITAADMVFDRVTFTARTLVRLITLSVELFEDADPSSEDVIANATGSTPGRNGRTTTSPPWTAPRSRASTGCATSAVMRRFAGTTGRATASPPQARKPAL
jgi:hypothetical protein